jgi:hypothetical protein
MASFDLVELWGAIFMPGKVAAFSLFLPLIDAPL